MTSFKTIVQALITAAVLLISSQGFAAGGYVSGKLEFWQKQGNYCPSSRDCTHTNYREASHFDRLQPIREAKVEIVNATDSGVVYGTGTTDTSGNYKIQWTSTGSAPSIKVLWKTRHKDTRFEIRSASSNGIYFFTSSGSVQLTNGTTSGSPQALPNYSWGNSASPNALANLYDGAHRTWFYALSYSGLMQSRFTNVQVKAFDATDCPTSCANGGTKTVTIDSTGSAFQPQGRIMHELGHIASYLSEPVALTIAYDHPNQCTGCGSWSLTSGEWSSAGFEEAIATLIGDVSIYWYDSPEPHTCLSSSSCGSSFNTETSLGTSGNCTTTERRSAMQRIRYLWDVYDNVNDSGYNDTHHIQYFEFFTTLDNYGPGVNNNQANEPWTNSNYNTVDNYDGRGTDDFVANLNALYSIDSTVQRTNNCNAF
jgi:hypothetical protein